MQSERMKAPRLLSTSGAGPGRGISLRQQRDLLLYAFPDNSGFESARCRVALVFWGDDDVEEFCLGVVDLGVVCCCGSVGEDSFPELVRCSYVKSVVLRSVGDVHAGAADNVGSREGPFGDPVDSEGGGGGGGGVGCVGRGGSGIGCGRGRHELVQDVGARVLEERDERIQ